MLEGTPLSIPNSKGPAQISGYPLVNQADPKYANWIEVELGRKYPVFINTPDPEIKLAYTGGTKRIVLLLNSNVLIPRYRYSNGVAGTNEIPEIERNTVVTETPLTDWSNIPNSTLAHSWGGYLLGIPKEVKFNRVAWAKFSRHLFTNEETGTYEDTVKYEHAAVFWFPVESLTELQDVYGITGKPLTYLPARLFGKNLLGQAMAGGHIKAPGYLGFSEIKVNDPEKAGLVYPILKAFGKKTFSYTTDWQPRVFSESLLQNPHLHELIPHLHITGDFNEVKLDTRIYSIDINKATSLLKSKADHFHCSFDLANKFLVPVAKARNTYMIEGLTKYTITGLSTGKWLLKSDLKAELKRNIKKEHLEQKQRLKQLTSKFGTLPKGISRLTDAQIALYYDIVKKREAGEVVPINEVTYLPNVTDDCHFFIRWLESSGHAYVCPWTKAIFISKFNSFDDIVKLPGFVDIMQHIFKNHALLNALMMSSVAHGAFLTAQL